MGVPFLRGGPFPWSAEPAGSQGQAVALHLGVILLSVLLLLLPGTWGECPAPAQFPSAMPTSQIHQPSFPVGTSLQYKCRPGYFRKQFNIICQENSVWTSAENICKRKSCTTPSDPQNGIVHVDTDTQFGSSIHYTCNIGYRLIGSSSAACIISDETVVWDTDPPICERIPCEPPPAIANGEVRNPTEDFEFGTVVTYHCNLGVRGEKLFELVGEPSIYCTTNDSQVGVWSGPPPQCIERNKCIPPLIENAVMVSENKGLFSLRDVVEFRCQPGFIMKGSSRVQCQAGNKWEPELPTCSKGQCTAPAQFPFARPTSQIHESTFPFGTSLQYECLPGYFRKQFNITCQETLVWTSAENICKRKSCTTPSAPPNGMVHVDTDTQFGSSIHYTCNIGYHLIGSSSAACIVSGETIVWDTDPPICERVKCSFSQFMTGIKKKLDIRTEYQYGDNVTMECEDGYKLDSSPHSQCQADGSWYPPLPKCIPRSRAGLIAGVIFGTLFFIFAGIFFFWMCRKYKKRSLHNSEELEATQVSLNPQVDKGNVHNGSQCCSKETHHELHSNITDEKSKEVNDSPEDGCVQLQAPLNKL